MSLKEIYDFCNYGKIHRELDKNDRMELKLREDNYIYNNIKFIAILFILIQIMYIVTGILAGVFKTRFALINIFSIGAVILASVVIILMTSFKSQKILSNIQHITFAYYMVIATSMMLMLSSNLTRGTEFVTTVFFAYLILAILPIPMLIYDCLIFIYIFISSTLIFIYVENHTSTSAYMLMYSIMVISLLAVNYVRISYFKGFYHQYRANLMTKELEKLSTTDFLTGLSNRQGLNSFLANELQESIYFSKVIGVAMLDIDNFKSYNDYYSHIVGDECLKAISQAINEAARENNMFAFRYGGEEFLVIDPDSNTKKMKEFSEMLLNRVRDLSLFRVDLDEKHEIVTVSLGVTTKKITSLDGYDLALKKADDCLYISKKSGRNCYTYKD